MANLNFTPNLLRHVQSPTARAEGATVGQVLEAYFRNNPQVRDYIVDEQGTVRPHVAIFRNGELIRDRNGLTDAVADGDEIFVAQALTGG